MTSFVLRPLWPLEGHDSDMVFAFGKYALVRFIYLTARRTRILARQL